MSHFSCLVLVPSNTDDPVEEATRLLAPYAENGEAFRDGSRWDWWSVGGRWTGSLTGYKPKDDPDNVHVCDLCGGTGRRPDADKFGEDWIAWSGGCNGCQGKGSALAWPTQWKAHDGDVVPVREIRTEFCPAAVVTPDGEWHEEGRMGWFGVVMETHESPGDWRMQVLQHVYRDHTDCTAVLVDCHV